MRIGDSLSRTDATTMATYEYDGDNKVNEKMKKFALDYYNMVDEYLANNPVIVSNIFDWSIAEYKKVILNDYNINEIREQNFEFINAIMKCRTLNSYVFYMNCLSMYPNMQERESYIASGGNYGNTTFKDIMDIYKGELKKKVSQY